MTIYVGKNTEPLHIEKMTDLIQFYPYIIGCASYNEGKSIIHLSSESWVNREERECLEWKLKELLKIYNRCKRKKIEFDVDEAVNQICWNHFNEEAYRELAKRVKEKGKKATVDNVHLKMHEYYRRELVDEMIKNELNPSDYGYERFIKDDKHNE